VTLDSVVVPDALGDGVHRLAGLEVDADDVTLSLLVLHATKRKAISSAYVHTSTLHSFTMSTPGHPF
jgi:hypothetical protein